MSDAYLHVVFPTVHLGGEVEGKGIYRMPACLFYRLVMVEFGVTLTSVCQPNEADYCICNP